MDQLKWDHLEEFLDLEWTILESGKVQSQRRAETDCLLLSKARLQIHSSLDVFSLEYRMRGN